jgi:signal transduction histidine kinase
MDQVVPVIENIRLVDRLASGAAEEERRRIARSVHDRVIQPYLGLQIGVKALHQELSRSGGQSISASADRAVILLDRLVAMTKEGVEELREYVNGLRNLPEGELRLSDLIRQFSTKFEAATGIHVNIVGDTCSLTMRDRLSIELFQMTTEALSNIHRHTEARVADVRLSMSDNSLELSIENESRETPHAFRPSSIMERADALGGRTEILWPSGRTLVRVEVPL